MVARDGDHRPAEPAQERCRPLVLLAPASVGEIAARDHEVRCESLHEGAEGRFDLAVLALAHVEVRDVENPGCHRRASL